MKEHIYQSLAAILRGATLLARFILTFVLARYATPSEVGLFGLYWGALQLSSSLMGLDVYAHTSRVLLSSGIERRSELSRHVGFLVLTCMAFLPISALLFSLSSPSISYVLIGLFCLHLPLEYYCQEIGRLLVPMEKPLAATIILFIRSALWVLPAICALHFGWNEDPIKVVVSFWLAGSMLAATLATLYLKTAGESWVWPTIDVSWIKKAVAHSSVFLFGTFVFRGILGLDRFVVNDVFGVEAAGIYTIYGSVSLGVLALLEAGVSAWRYPALVAALQAKKRGEAGLRLKRFIRDSFISSSLLLISISFLFPVLAKMLLPEVYTRHILAFYAMIVGVFFYSLSLPFHYFIYGLKLDVMILFIYLLSLMSMLVWAYGFMVSLGIVGAGVMLAIPLILIAIQRVMVVTWHIRHKEI